MTITLSYPGGLTLPSYIDNVTNSYLADYNEFEGGQLRFFVAEIAAKITNIIDSEITDGAKTTKINKLQSFLNDLELDQLELELAISQNSISDNSDASSEALCPITELELYTLGDKSSIEVTIKNKKIILKPGQEIERLQGFARVVAQKCISEICDATLNNSQDLPMSPSQAMLPRGGNSLGNRNSDLSFTGV